MAAAEHFLRRQTDADIHTSCDDDGEDKDKKEEGEEGGCGMAGLRPAVLRGCGTVSVFTAVYSVSGLLTSTLSAYVNSQVTTLERQFGFNSSQTGLIMAANDIGFLVVVLFVSYMANKVHIPRCLGWLTILFGTSGIVCALPHFLFGAPHPPSHDVNATFIANMSPGTSSRHFTGQICDGVDFQQTDCADARADTDEGSAREGPPDRAGAALVVLVMGMVVQGVAKAPRSSFVTTFIDRNAVATRAGFLLGIAAAVSLLGYAAAFALGGVFANIHVTLQETELTPRHPRWVGAWWLGYVTFGVAACVCAVPLLCFPPRVKGGKPHQQPVSRSHRVSAPALVPAFLKGLAFSLLRLLMNPVYMLALLSSCALLFTAAGAGAFYPKYIENQFDFPVWKANLAMAGMMLSTNFLGTLIGGYLTKRFKMGGLACLKLASVMQALAMVFKALMMLFSCPQPPIHNHPGFQTIAENKESGCYGNCGCDNEDFFPVCGEDGKTFFSPCHAGCLHSGGMRYVNCSCIAGGGAAAGLCDYGCPMFAAFLASLCLSSICSTLAIIPKVVIFIRSVDGRDVPLAFGLYSFLTSITGWMMGPIAFGKLIDGICSQWEKSCTGGGACRLYDNDSFRLKLFGYQTLLQFLALALVVAALLVARVNATFDKRVEGHGGTRTGMDKEIVVANRQNNTKQATERDLTTAD